MHFGIDATNIVRGEGVTHLREMLNAAGDFLHHDRVKVWSSQPTLDELNYSHWLNKVTHPMLNRGKFSRSIWKAVIFDKEIAKAGCDVLFVPDAGVIRPPRRIYS